MTTPIAALAEARRTFAHRRVLRLTRPVLEHGIALLTRALSDAPEPVGTVIGIAHGGTIPATLIASTIPAPRRTVLARHNPTDDLHQQATGRAICDTAPLARALDGRRLRGHVLLVDDICGTGATFAAVRDAIAPHLHLSATVTAAALCRNVGAHRPPDLHLWDVDDWVHFPWERPLPPGTTVEDLAVPERAITP